MALGVRAGRRQSGRPYLITALEDHLGLKVEARRAPVPVVVIDLTSQFALPNCQPFPLADVLHSISTEPSDAIGVYGCVFICLGQRGGVSALLNKGLC